MGRFVITEIQPNEHYKMLAWLICIVGALFYCYEYFLRIAPSIMANDLMRSFHITAGQYGDLNAFFYYAYTPAQLFVGILLDRYGPRRLLMLACFGCVLGAWLFGGAHVFWVAALGRFLVGFGASFAFVGALKLATIWLPPERFAALSGATTALGMVGAMFGDVVMAKSVEQYGWRMTISFSVYAGIVIVLLIFLIVRDRLKTTQKQPTFVPELSFRDVFIGLLQALRNRHIWINGLMGCFLYLPITAFAELWGVPYLVQVHHFTHVHAAEIVSAIFLGWAIGCPIAGWISDSIKLRRLPMQIGAIFALVICSVILYTPQSSAIILFILFLALGLSTSVQVLIFAVGREVSPKHISGTAISLTNMFTMIGGAVFQPVIGVILDHAWTGEIINGVHVYSSHTYTIAMSVLPLALILTIFLSLFLRETHGYLS